MIPKLYASKRAIVSICIYIHHLMDNQIVWNDQLPNKVNSAKHSSNLKNLTGNMENIFLICFFPLVSLIYRFAVYPFDTESYSCFWRNIASKMSGSWLSNRRNPLGKRYKYCSICFIPIHNFVFFYIYILILLSIVVQSNIFDIHSLVCSFGQIRLLILVIQSC